MDLQLFREIIALHSIGKPVAHKTGNRNLQRKETLRILSKLQHELQLSHGFHHWAKVLLSQDFLGSYMQQSRTLFQTADDIRDLAKSAGQKIQELFYLMTVLYQCDIGSYTADAGGLHYLEKMFEYESGRKVYNPVGKLLEFGPTYKNRYAELKEKLNKPNDAKVPLITPDNITFKYGNIFNSSCQTIVNTVNCVGVMGKGIALVYKLRHPPMYEQYRKHCQDGLLKIGTLSLYKTTDSSPWILNFPTKNHWKYPSKIEYLEAGLIKFAETWESKGIKSIAFPLLGADNGGLEKSNVIALMYKHLQECNLPIEIYEYDPQAEDGAFNKFQDKWSNTSEQTIKEVTGIQSQYINKINELIAGGEITSMISLANYPGIGTKTLEKAFRFALDSTALPEREMFLPFSD